VVGIWERDLGEGFQSVTIGSIGSLGKIGTIGSIGSLGSIGSIGSIGLIGSNRFHVWIGNRLK